MTKYQDSINGWPYTKFESTSKRGIEQCKQLAELLPHGSGINGDWKIKKIGNKFIASNYYEAMDDNGSYCHCYDFTAYYKLVNGKFEYIDKLNFHNQREYACCGYQIKDYLADTLCEINYIQEGIK